MKKYLGLIIVLVLSWWAIRPLLSPFMFPIHDDTQVVRVYEMAKALKDGQFPVRWVADLGYGFGYPIFNFYSPLPYYVGAFFVLLGIDVLWATKLMFMMGILLSGIFMYRLAREFWGEQGAVISALFYVYAPYHAVDIYVRGAVGEFWALAFLPLMAWGIYKAVTKHRWVWVTVGSLGYAGVILSHNIMAMVTTLFLAIGILLSFLSSLKKKNLLATYYLILVILLGLGLSIFFWLPALKEMGETQVFSQIGGGADFRDHFVCLWQLWDSPWGYGGSAPGCSSDGMSFKIGKLHLLMAVVSIILLFLWRKKDKLRSRVVLLSSFFFLLSTFMTLEISKPIWDALPFLAYTQYPWRLLVFVIFSVSFVSGAALLWFKRKRNQLLVGAIVIFMLIFLNSKYFKPQNYLNLSAADYVGEENIKWKTSKISDEYLPKDFPRPKTKEEIAMIAKRLQTKPMEYNFKVNTPLRIFANLVSLFSFILVIGGSFYVRKKEG